MDIVAASCIFVASGLKVKGLGLSVGLRTSCWAGAEDEACILKLGCIMAAKSSSVRFQSSFILFEPLSSIDISPKVYFVDAVLDVLLDDSESNMESCGELVLLVRPRASDGEP